MAISEHFQNLIAMAAADGNMSESELRLLSHRATEFGVTDDEFEEAIRQAIDNQIEFSVPQRIEERIEILKDLIRMMAADGRLDESEKKLFAIVAALYEVTGDQLNQLIDEVLEEA